MIISGATPNYKGPKEEAAVSSEGSSELDKIAGEYSEETRNDYSDVIDNADLLSISPTFATLTATKHFNELAKNKTDVQRQKTNKEDKSGKQGEDYFFWKAKPVHHHVETLCSQQNWRPGCAVCSNCNTPVHHPVVHPPAPVVHPPAPVVHHTLVQGLASAADCPGTVTCFG